MNRLSLCLGVGLLGCGDPDVRIVEGSAVEHGQMLFGDPTVSGAPQNRVSCADCHETSATRSGPLPGAPLAGATLRPSFWGGQEPSLLRAMNHCLYYFMSSPEPWTGDEVEARALYAYLESLEPGDSGPQAFTIGALADPGRGNAERGAAIYQSACGSCHGARNSGVGALIPSAPRLPTDWRAAHPDPDYNDEERRLVFVEKTRHGGFLGYGGEMPPLSIEALSDEGLADILAYLEVP